MFRASIARKPTAERHMRSQHVAEDRLAALSAITTSEAAKALFAAGWAARRYPPPYEQFSAAPALDVDGSEAKDPDAYAESIVVYHHTADSFDASAVRALFASTPDVLDALDALFARHPPASDYKRSFLTMYVGQLGAYVGRVLVKSGGAWEVRAPLMQSRVRLGERLIDPFEIAYRSVFDRASLAASYARVTSGAITPAPRPRG